MGGSHWLVSAIPQGVSSAHESVVFHARSSSPLTDHINLCLRAMVPCGPLCIYNHRLLIWERETNKSSRGLWILMVELEQLIPARQ